MSTFEMLEKTITLKKERGVLTDAYITSTKTKMDVFLMADRITTNEYDQLTALLGS